MDNQYYRDGSARWSTEQENIQAGLTGNTGIPIGFTESGRQLLIDSIASIMLFGGAGSQKLTSYFAYDGLLVMPSLFLDFKGEISAILMHSQINLGASWFCWNPYGLFSEMPWCLPQNRINPFEGLTVDNPYLQLDAKLHMQGMISTPAPNSGNKGDFFVKRAREWASETLIWMVETLGKIDIPDFYSMLCFMESDPEYWGTILEQMKSSRFENVRRIAGEQEYKRENAEAEYSGVLATIFANLNVLGDELLTASLREPDISISDFYSHHMLQKGALVVSAEHATLLAPVLKSIFTAVMIGKQRAPKAPRLFLGIDEAAQLQSFSELLRVYEYGRGANIVAKSAFQSIGQVETHHGQSGLKTLMSSAQTRIFTGIRDIETAELVSRMLGDETLFYKPELQQAQAKHAKMQAVASLMAGVNPFHNTLHAKYYDYAHDYKARKRRRLMTASEVLNMPQNRAINFISDLDIYPYQAYKVPYFTQPHLVGWFMPNPLLGVNDRVQVGNRSLSVVCEPVPDAIAHMPQYQRGVWSYVQGYRPNLSQYSRYRA